MEMTAYLEGQGDLVRNRKENENYCMALPRPGKSWSGAHWRSIQEMLHISVYLAVNYVRTKDSPLKVSSPAFWKISLRSNLYPIAKLYPSPTTLSLLYYLGLRL